MNLREEIQDETFLFPGTELSEKEREELKRKKKVLEAAEAYKRQLDSMDVDTYRMPDSYDDGTEEGRQKKHAALFDRYRYGEGFLQSILLALS